MRSMNSLNYIPAAFSHQATVKSPKCPPCTEGMLHNTSKVENKAVNIIMASVPSGVACRGCGSIHPYNSNVTH